MVAPIARTALGVVILIDVLRVFLPSLITSGLVHAGNGDPGATPAS